MTSEGERSDGEKQFIRRAHPGDEVELARMIHELAAFEHAADQCTVTENHMRTALFGPQPIAYAHVVEVDGQFAAGAVWYVSFSTWDGVAGIYLEDLFVRPAYRRRGLARQLLKTLAAECVAAGYSRLTWAVLDWNSDAIALYDAVGGKPLSDWISYRISGSELSEFAESG
jgi:GNAT superfamily N-acetyltransferase